MSQFITELKGRAFEYSPSSGYRVRITFQSENALTWLYLEAPQGQTGKTNTEQIERRDISAGVHLLSWTEQDGSNVVDVLDTTTMKMYANFVLPNGQRFMSTADTKEVTADTKEVTADTKEVTADTKEVTADTKEVTGAMTLIFYPVPGLAETARIAAKIGGLPLEDKRVTPGEWKDIKPTTQKGSLPCLIIGDTEITQSFSVIRYVAKKAGLYPEDPELAALVDEKLYVFEDRGFDPFLPSFGMSDVKDKAAARAALIGPGGKISVFLRYLDTALAESKSNFLVGDCLTIADIQCFARLGFLFDSPWMTGVGDQGMLKQYANIQQFRRMMMQLPAISAMYEGNSDPMRRGYTLATLD